MIGQKWPEHCLGLQINLCCVFHILQYWPISHVLLQHLKVPCESLEPSSTYSQLFAALCVSRKSPKAKQDSHSLMTSSVRWRSSSAISLNNFQLIRRQVKFPRLRQGGAVRHKTENLGFQPSQVTWWIVWSSYPRRTSLINRTKRHNKKTIIRTKNQSFESFAQKVKHWNQKSIINQ